MDDIATYLAPAYWADALLNNDWSGLTPDESERAARWARGLPGPIVDCGNSIGLTDRHDADTVIGRTLTECLSYYVVATDI